MRFMAKTTLVMLVKVDRKGLISVNNSHEIFMLVVEEMSFTKAARRAFLTQQCVSDHVKRLEQEYNTTFFERRPKLKLLPAGEVMYNSLLQISDIKKKIRIKIKEMVNGKSGNLTIGISASRAKAIMSGLIEKYSLAYPNVTISIFSNNTLKMEKMLIKEELDVMVAANATNNALYKVLPLIQDDIYLVISDKLLERFFPDNFVEIKRNFIDGADLAVLEHVPFARNFPDSRINLLIDKHLDRCNINIKTIFSVSDYDAQLNLCAMNMVAAFLPTTILGNIMKFNTHNPTDKINIFQVKGLRETLRIDCIYLRNSHKPQYIITFIKLLEDVMKKEKQLVLENLKNAKYIN